MITINLFDIPFLANTLVGEVVVSPATDTLVDENGNVYTGGSYDTFEGYTSGSNPSSLGFGWATPWQFDALLNRSIMAEDFLDYSVGTIVSGSNSGSGWKTSWNVVIGS